jgi:UDP-N-acetylmuramoyl-tripeptide--D-alanyl-D-alanine ligase
MIPLRGSEIAAALGATASPEAAAAVVRRLATNHKDVRPGDLFLARRGEKHDGRRFAADALQAGAALVVGERGTDAHPLVLETDDGLVALARIAALVRARYEGPLIAIAGSAGKTSTKDLLHGLLAPSRPTVASEKSFNNHAGVPMTLCRIEPETKVAIVEAGTNHPGELAPLCALARPTAAVLVSIGAEHLEGFGDLAGVLREESEVARALPPGAPLYLDADDPVLARAEFPAHVRVVRAGFGPAADVRAEGAPRSDRAPAFRLSPGGPVIAAPRFPYSFFRTNLLLACLVARDLGVSEEDLARLAPTLAPAPLRGEARRCGAALVWVDCYNANPLSAGRALEELAQAEGRRAAILGDMLELGADAPSWHEDLGRRCRAAGVAEAVFVGAHGADFRRGFGAGELVLRPDAAAATDDFRRLVGSAGTVLVKASRGVALERVLEACP